jgi:tetratricopeptide (TPR) repeat protein
MRHASSLAVALVLVAAALPAAGSDLPEPKPLAPSLAGLGEHHHPISSKNPAAQRFFDQGMVLAFGFNHAEAERAFREAARLDPQCAICWWGAAWVLGTNYNLPMAPEAVPVAWEALGNAQRLARRASRRERAYIEALAMRYSPEVVADRAPLERAFSDAMGEVVRRYPDDLDAAIVFAESRMNLIPWDLWTATGEAKPEAADAIAALESVLERDPEHPQALHLWIHAMEKLHPEKAEAAADALRGLVPGAGHLVHMPSHIYIRRGRYADALAVNQDADRADEAYVAQCHAQGIYPLAYHSHNVHFIATAAGMEGKSSVALEASSKLERRHQEQHEMMVSTDLATLQIFYAMPFYSMVRFGRWDEILAAPEPASDLAFARVGWHYARGLAYARKDALLPARAELAAVGAYADDPKMAELTIFGINSFAQIFAIAREVLAGEIAAEAGDFETAIAHLEAGVELEDALLYTEPPDWQVPVRQSLGAVLLAAGQPEEAERIYRQDLEIYPRNGWSLYGLAQALAAQGKDATAVEQEFQAAWKDADVEISSSRF